MPKNKQQSIWKGEYITFHLTFCSFLTFEFSIRFMFIDIVKFREIDEDANENEWWPHVHMLLCSSVAVDSVSGDGISGL